MVHQLVPNSLVRVAHCWLARVTRTGIPALLIPLCDRALLPPRLQAGGALLLGALPVLAVIANQWLPDRSNMSGLAVFAVLAAGLGLRCWLLIPVVAVACASELAYGGLGELDPLAMGGRIGILYSVALVSRLSVLGWIHLKDGHGQDMRTLLQVSHAVGSSLDLAHVAAEAVRAAAGTVSRPGLAGGRPAALLRVSGGAVALVSACDATGVDLGAVGEVPLGQASAPVLQAQSSRLPMVVTADQVPAGLRELVHVGSGSVWALARVADAGEPFGVLAVASPHPGEFRREDLRLLDGIARVAGLAIATALRHAELDELKGRLQHSVMLALEAGQSLEPADVIASTLVRVADSVGADRVALARLEGDGKVVVESTYRAGGRPVTLGRRFSSESVRSVPELARTLATLQPLTTGPLEAGQAGRALAGVVGDGRHTLLFPLSVAGGMTFVLVLSRRDGQPFGPADLGRLGPMADVALLALRNAHLYARAERAQLEASTYSGRLQLAIEAAQDIGSSLELAEVLEGVLRRAVQVTHAERGSISRASDGRMIVECEHDPAGSQLGIGTEWSLSASSLAAEAVRTGKPVLGDRSAPEPPTLAGWRERARVEQIVMCPLMVGRQLVGVLGLSRRRRRFSEADVLTLQPFATLAALLLRNARLLAEARQVGEAKSSFLKLAAHELRTPLAVIRGYLSMLEEGTYEVAESTRGVVGILVVKACELESLVEALLMTARLETGSLAGVPARIDMAEAVREALDRVGPRAMLENAALDARLPEVPLWTRADPGHVGRILDNLLNNALTYSQSPAEVAVTLRRRTGIEVVVEDHGIGIPGEQHDRVFDRFHRLDGETSRFNPGLGLGLSISRELAEVNGGSLCLERSAPGEGSTFVLRLPEDDLDG